jgi:hypothetical protein
MMASAKSLPHSGAAMLVRARVACLGGGASRCRGLDRGANWIRLAWLAFALLAAGPDASAQTNQPGAASASLPGGLVPFKLNLGVEAAQQPQDVDVGIKILFAITLLSLAPSIILLMTSFTRIAIVLSFVRSALSLQGVPANQIIIGLSLFMTYFIMEPVWSQIDRTALTPYREKQISSEEALARASGVHAQADAAQGCGALRGPGQAGAHGGGGTAAQGGGAGVHPERTAHGVSDGLPALRAVYPH